MFDFLYKNFDQFVIYIKNNPINAIFIIILISYLLEDIAIILSAYLSIILEGILSVPIAIFAIFFGIISGDMILYYIGKYLTKYKKIKNFIDTHKSTSYIQKKFYKDNTSISLFVMRFIPGLRTIGYILSGVYSVKIKQFLSIVVIASTLWISFVFIGIFYSKKILLLDILEQYNSVSKHIMLLFLIIFFIYIFNHLFKFCLKKYY